MTDALAALRRHLPAAVTDAAVTDDAPGLWHETGRRPRIRVEVADADDVATAVRVAVDHGLPVAVWGGRYDTHGRNAGDGAVVVDLRRLRAGRFDPRARTLTVGGGARVADVLAALPAGRMTATTSNPQVGIVGAGLGGGYGPLLGRYGLVADQLVGARLVLADGSAVAADPALLWGLRGGGSGFGVVTEATFATHPLEAVLTAPAAVPLDRAAAALRTVQDLVDEEPEHLGVLPLFATGPDGAALHLAVHWSGAAARGERVLAAVPGAGAVRRVPFAESLNHDEDVLFPAGRGWTEATCTIPRIDADVAATLVAAARAVPSPRSVLFLHDFHGAPTRVAPDATAFPLRRAHFVVAAVTPHDPGDAAAARRHQDWADDVARALPALPGGYVNFLPPSATDQVAAFYGPAVPRLAALKRRADPAGVFTGISGLPAPR